MRFTLEVLAMKITGAYSKKKPLEYPCKISMLPPIFSTKRLELDI